MKTTTCEKCKRNWFDDSEQAACIRVYGQCIVCCVEMEKSNNYQWSINIVVRDKQSYEKGDKNG